MSVSQDLEEPLLCPKEDRPGSKAAAEKRAECSAERDTFWACSINLAKVITGAGMMAIPRAFLQIGWLPGSLMLVGVALLTFFTLAVLVQGSAATHASTYGELVCRTCGQGLMKVLQLAVLLFCFGFSVVYLVVIRDILLGTSDCNGLLCEALGPGANIDARLLVIAVAVLVCAPLLIMRSMEKLSALNAAGVAATVILAVVSAALAAVAAFQGQAHGIPMLPQWDLLGHTRAEQLEALTDVIPVILACYVAHQSLHPLMPLLKPYSQERMLKVIAVALSVSCSIFLFLSVGAAVTFGPSTDINVLNNFSIEGLEPLLGWRTAVILSWVVRGGYLVCILATLLLYMHPLRSCLAQMLWPEADEGQQGQTSEAAAVAAAAAAASAAPTAGLEGTVGSSAGVQQDGVRSMPQCYQQQQAQPVLQVQDSSNADAYVAPQRQIWQDLEQAVYYPLTYGLLAAMVLAAVAVANIYQAVSAVGDIASTMQAFIVPGVVAVALVVRQREQLQAAAAAAAAAFLSDVERGVGVLYVKAPVTTQLSVESVLYAAAGGFVLVLGVALFSNGVLERLSAFL